MNKLYILHHSPEYKLWRANIYRRDKWKCKICGKKERIEAHHIYPLRSYYEKRFDLHNGITLCFKCHRLIFGKELLVAQWLLGLIKINGVNSVNIHKDNTEPNQEGNFLGGVTTRNRSYRLEQFQNKKVKCSGCGNTLIRHYYRSKRSNKFFCNSICHGKYLKGKKPSNYLGSLRQKCWWCGKLTECPTRTRRIKKYCNNSCQLKYEYKNSLRKKKSYLNGRWTKNFLKCVICGGKEKPHYGKGKCMPCYNKVYNSKLS